ncbi:MAG: glycosyl hydrolase, partial [Acidobacteria bacterium]|nr:glycosyl hydrolase [Acidobacteriota bacterium]
VVFASVSGALWHQNPAQNAARGLWKTSNGGTTWKKVIDAGADAGVVEVAIDLSRPTVMYAASWQRERRDFSFIPSGPGTALWKTTDGGDTWQKMSIGLPTSPMGRIGLSVCRSQPATVYAVIDGADGGVYRSTDAGATWVRRNPVAASSNYYGQVRCDPTDPQRVFFLQTAFSVSTDGGATFKVEPLRGVHVDHHALWINPANSEHVILGNDGGIYQSFDKGANWRFHGQFAGTQFYSVAVDMREPFYNVYGGAQDNNALGGPSATRHADGIANDDWYVTTGGDGLSAQVEPGDPSVVYTESQYGALVRFNPFTGERRNITPRPPTGVTYRWNWNSPIRIAPTDGTTLYFGSQFVFRSKDRGATWQTISPDLTKTIVIDPKYRMSDYGTLRWIDASPRKAGWLATGSDDGLIHVSEDDGATWKKAAPLPGVPETAQILRVMFSHHDDRTLFAVASAHEDDDRRPYLFESTDLGTTWTSVLANLPRTTPVMSFVEDPVNPRLWFAGNQTGVFVTLNGGASWQSLRGSMPTVAIHDMVIHPREHDLVVATHGRGFWILDSLVGLEALPAALSASSDLAVFAPRPSTIIPRFNKGRDAQGQSFYTAPNPPAGALIDYYTSAAGPVAPTIEIVNAAGTVVRTLSAGPNRGGLQRVVWDLRTTGGAGVPSTGRGGNAGTAPAAPGTYTVKVTLDGKTAQANVVVR